MTLSFFFSLGVRGLGGYRQVLGGGFSWASRFLRFSFWMHIELNEQNMPMYVSFRSDKN